MNTEIIIFIATIVTMFTGIMSVYYARKGLIRKRGKPKKRSLKHKKSQTEIICDIATDSDVTIDVNVKITAEPGSNAVIFHK